MIRILAIDLGTSSVKFMRMDKHARVLSVDRAPMSDLSVEAWIAALQENLTAHGDQRDIGGIAVTGQMHGLMTREHDATWGVGIPWHDRRSTDLLPAIREAIGPHAITTTGGPIAPGFLAASLAWVRQHDPDRWSRITSVHLPKDALIHELTGEHVTDPSDAAGTGIFAPHAGDWAWPVVDALGIPREWLARLVPAGSIAGGLGTEYASVLGLQRGLPIIVAGGDAPAGAYGAGVMRDSDALAMLSTGSQVILPSHAWSPDPEGCWYTWPSVAPESNGYAPYLKTGTLMNAGNVIRWAERVLAEGKIGPVSSGLVVLPHLIGTREMPAWRGAIIGLSEHTTAGEIRRALVEAIAFSVRAKMEEMAGTAGTPMRIRLAGGLAHRPDVRQLFADVLGTPIETVSQPELTAYGAGLLALHTLAGLLPDQAVDAAEVTRPSGVNAYDDQYALYHDIEQALAPVTARIAALREDAT